MIPIFKSALIAIAANAASFIFLAIPAQAKQCIWNKSGFIVNVHWYRPADIGVHRSDLHDSPDEIWGVAMPDGRRANVARTWPIYAEMRANRHPQYLQARDYDLMRRGAGELRTFAPPVQTGSISAGFGNCTNTDEKLVALVAKVGWGSPRIAIERGTPMTSTAGFGVRRPVEPLLCLSNNYRDGQYCHTSMVDPPISGDLVVAIMPSTTHYLDFWGTVFTTIEWGQGGPIN